MVIGSKGRLKQAFIVTPDLCDLLTLFSLRLIKRLTIFLFSFCFSEDTISEEIVECLRLSSFDSMEWSDEQLLSLLYLMFADLNLIELFQLDPPTLRNFLFQVYKNYNQVPFHNFRHSFCVAQMVSFYHLYIFRHMLLSLWLKRFYKDVCSVYKGCVIILSNSFLNFWNNCFINRKFYNYRDNCSFPTEYFPFNP